MKKILWLLIAAALVISAAAPVLAAGTTIADVSPDHWAYQAVKTLVDKGYLGLYQDKTFRGNEPVDRFTLAVLVARMLGDVVSGDTAMTKVDGETLRKLTDEFRKELVGLSAKAKTLEEALARYESDRAVLGADMAAWRDETSQVRQELAGALQDIINLKERMAAVEAETADLQQRVAALETEVEAVGKQLNIWKIMTGVFALLAIFG